MKTSIAGTQLIDHFLLNNDLSTYDPYDVWKDGIGFNIKKLYYKKKIIGIIPAGLIYVSDLLFNTVLKHFYIPQEYPIVRAQASLTLLNCFEKTKDRKYLKFARMHLDWLIENYSKGYSGHCWGINFLWASKNSTYDKNTPYITVTPYVLEALIKYKEITNDLIFDKTIESISLFIEKDLKIKQDNTNIFSLSYAPVEEPRIVINANSYALYVYAMLLDFFPEKEDYILNKIDRLYNFIAENQNRNGSWLYFADNLPGNFIDCFHTCFILKNLIKASNLHPKIKIDSSVIEQGVLYLKQNFLDIRSGLFKRFSITDVPSLIKFDLYDNAEMLNLYFLLNKMNQYNNLSDNIHNNFVCKNNIFSKVDFIGEKRFKNNLRWAVLPYLHALSFNS